MRRLSPLLITLCVLAGVAQADPLPTNFEALGIPVPVSLGMKASDLKNVKGEVIRSGRFVTVSTENGHHLSITLAPNADTVAKIVAAVPKDKFSTLKKTFKGRYSKGNQYEGEKQLRFESCTWQDGERVLRLVQNVDACRVELSNQTK